MPVTNYFVANLAIFNVGTLAQHNAAIATINAGVARFRTSPATESPSGIAGKTRSLVSWGTARDCISRHAVRGRDSERSGFKATWEETAS
jgi:hypothetical protein